MPQSQQHNKSDSFIPARESPFFTGLFGLYTRTLFKRRFKNVWLKQNYTPGSESRTIYYLNHSSWWDGITPLLLNQYLFRQKARAMMEDIQMNQYKFFRWIGAFSVSLNNPRTSIRSLRYAIESMQRENASLFIYPEGKMVPFSTRKPQFRDGLSWICRQLPDVEIVPIGTYIHTLRFDRPEIHIQIGRPVDTTTSIQSNSDLKQILEEALRDQLIDLQKHGGFDDSYFEKWL